MNICVLRWYMLSVNFIHRKFNCLSKDSNPDILLFGYQDKFKLSKLTFQILKPKFQLLG